MNKQAIALVAAALFCLPLAATAQTKSVPVRKVLYKDANTKKYNASVTMATFVGNAPLVELASENSGLTLLSLIDEYIKENGEMKSASLTMKPTVTLARPDLISVYYDRVTDTAGAHPASDFVSFSYGMVGGLAKKLELKDLFTKDSDTYTILTSAAVRYLQEEGLPREVREKAARTAPDTWAITPQGILLLYPAGTIDAYASGHYKILCSWKELDSLNDGRLSVLVKPLRK